MSVSLTHAGIEITYHEESNTWKFELRGRHRSAPSLAQAKAAIDKPVDQSDKPPFERREAYWQHSRWAAASAPFSLVTVTSVAESRYNNVEFWILHGKERHKVSQSALFEASERNKAKIDKIKELNKEHDKIENVRRNLHESLDTIKE